MSEFSSPSAASPASAWRVPGLVLLAGLGLTALAWRHPSAILGGGLVASLALAGLSAGLLRRRASASALAETRYRAIFEQASVAMAWSTLDGNLQAANPAFLTLVGYTEAELLGTPLSRFSHPEHRDHDQALRQAMIAGPSPLLSTETRWLRKDGSPIWVALTVRTVADATGRPRFLFGMITDITESVRLQDDLKQILREQEIILEHANVGISRVVQRRQVWVNAWMERVLQYSKTELEGFTTRQLYPSQEAYDQLGEAAYATLARGEVFEIEQELVRKDGVHLWLQYNGKAIDPTDMDQGTLWILSDTTLRHQAELDLRKSEALFRTMFEAQGAIMLLIDPSEGRIVDANPAAAAFYGYPRQQLRTMLIGEINTTPSDRLGQIQPRGDQIGHSTHIFPHRLANGSVRTVQVDATPITILGTNLVFSVIQDRTEQMRFEEALLLRQAQLEQLNHSLEQRVEEGVLQMRHRDQMLIIQSGQAAMGEMLGNIAHQWRQPLNTLSMLLLNLKDDQELGELSEAGLQNALAKADRLIQKMSATINDFTHFFRRGKTAQAFSALHQVTATVALVDASFASSGITVRIETAEDALLFGYSNEYAQVLLNLLSNAKQAILAIGRSGGLVRIYLHVQAGLGCLTVSDNGGGIPEALLDRIFEPYFSTRESGTGIGLYMSKQIIEGNMAGHITVSNRDGGAEFVLSVPLAGGTP